jgi:hypothetical protein
MEAKRLEILKQTAMIQVRWTLGGRGIGGIEERRSTEVFQNLKINKYGPPKRCTFVRLIQWGTIVKGFPIALC